MCLSLQHKEKMPWTPILVFPSCYVARAIKIGLSWRSKIPCWRKKLSSCDPKSRKTCWNLSKSVGWDGDKNNNRWNKKYKTHHNALYDGPTGYLYLHEEEIIKRATLSLAREQWQLLRPWGRILITKGNMRVWLLSFETLGKSEKNGDEWQSYNPFLMNIRTWNVRTLGGAKHRHRRGILQQEIHNACLVFGPLDVILIQEHT